MEGTPLLSHPRTEINNTHSISTRLCLDLLAGAPPVIAVLDQCSTALAARHPPSPCPHSHVASGVVRGRFVLHCSDVRTQAEENRST